MKAALEKIEAALKECPDDTDALRVKSMILASLDRTAEAALVLEELVEHEPDDLDIRYILGRVYCKLELWEKAVIHLEKSLESPNRTKDARELLVSCYEKTGKPAKAIPLLEAILKENPGDSVLITQMGNLQLGTREYTAARRSFRAAIDINPKLLQAYEGLAVSNALLEKYGETEKVLTEAIVQFPREPGFRIRLAETYLKLGRPLDALTVIEQLKGLTGETKQIELLRNAAATILKAQGKLVPPK